MTQSLVVPFIGIEGPPGQVTYVDWVIAASPLAQPYQVQRADYGVLVNLTGGALSVQFFVANGGDPIVIRDYLGLAGGAPVTLLTDGTTGAKIEDPSHPGVYNLNTSTISTANQVARWKFSAILNLWILW